MGEFHRKDFFVDPDIGIAEALPASAFIHPEFLELEMVKIFNRSWILIPPRSSSLSEDSFGRLYEPNARIPVSVLDKPLFLQRNSKNELNCFPNVCTHAWHALVESASTGGSIVCPQHGRVFDSDGKFVSHKGFEMLNDFPRESDNLRKLEMESWDPFVFVCLDKPLASFKTIIRPMVESFAGLRIEDFRYRPVSNEIRVVDGNWKQHAWNYMDNYHIRFVHKGAGGLAGAIDLESYRTELYDYSSLQWAYARRSADGFAPEQVASRFQDTTRPEKRVFALWWFIFPNLTFNFYPWGLSVNQYMPVLGRPDKTQFNWLQYSLDDSKFEQRNKVWLNEQVDEEDIDAISLVSKGARSGFAPRGRFAPREEPGPHWFHRLLYRNIFEET